ncbi:MAG: hypothetical protein ABFD96_18605 [Armatimonadia bacterium]
MLYGRRRPYLCFVLCVLMVWLSCSALMAKPIKSQEKAVEQGTRALHDALTRHPEFKPDKKILTDKAIGIVGKDDKGTFGMTLVPLLYPGEPKVGGKSVTMGYIVLTDLEEKATRPPAVIQLSATQIKQDTFQIQMKELNTGKVAETEELNKNATVSWQKELTEEQQADPTNGNAAMWTVNDNDAMVAFGIKTTSTRTWAVFVVAIVVVGLPCFGLGYFLGWAMFSSGWFW